jgi:hypothetical protein
MVPHVPRLELTGRILRKRPSSKRRPQDGERTISNAAAPYKMPARLLSRVSLALAEDETIALQ